MYAKYFDLKQAPFSIAPDPRYLYMSEQHREALGHLLYGVNGQGGFVVLTGEIGAGKTTVCRCFLEQIPRRSNVAYIFNPKQTVLELLQSICDEFRIPYQAKVSGQPTVKDFVDPLNEFLLRTHAVGQNNVLIIDEAQNLSVDVLEQLRLLTNLETNERKLLQIVLIGQPELRVLLARPDLEQLAQRVIARFHLHSLSEEETSQYIWHRLSVAGKRREPLFDAPAIRRIYAHTHGVPRRINLLCDRALLGAYASHRTCVDRAIVDKAAAEVFGAPSPLPFARERLDFRWRWLAGIAGLSALLLILWWQLGSAQVHAWSLTAQGTRVAALGPGATTQAKAAMPRRAAAPLADVDAEQWLRTLGPPIADTESAWRALGARWNMVPWQGALCEAAGAQQLRCFKSDLGLTLIRQLDRPCLLPLNLQGQTVLALLAGLDERRATLFVGGQSRNVTLTSLGKLWRGDFVTLWRIPNDYQGQIRWGQTGASVDWLAQALAQWAGQARPAAGLPFGAAMQDEIRAFQIAHGLKSDAIAGSTTFMLLNRLQGVQEPHLIAPASASSMRSR